MKPHVYVIAQRLALAAGVCACLILAGPSVQAQEVTPKAPKVTPKSPKAVPERAVAPPEAEELPAKPVDRRRLLEELYTQLGEATDKESAKLVAEAIEKLWVASGSDTVNLLLGRAMKMVEADDYDLALKLLDAIVDLAPDFSEGWNQRATVHFLKRDFQRSLEDLRRVLRLDPKHFKAISGLALILEELGNKDAALKAYRQALKVHPFLSGVAQSAKELERDVEGQGI